MEAPEFGSPLDPPEVPWMPQKAGGCHSCPSASPCLGVDGAASAEGSGLCPVPLPGAEPAVSPTAAGLYYLAELIEEYTVVTRRIIKYMIWVSPGAGSDGRLLPQPP